MKPSIAPSALRSGETLTSHQRGAPFAVGQKASNRVALPARASSIAPSSSGVASAGQSDGPALSGDRAEIVDLHRALAVAVHIIDRAARPDHLDAIRALIEDRGQHLVGGAAERIGQGRQFGNVHFQGVSTEKARAQMCIACSAEPSAQRPYE